MAVIATVLAAMTPTLKAMALQTALNVGINQVGKLFGDDNAEVAGQAVQAFAGGDMDGLVDIGANFATKHINNFASNPQSGQFGQIASQGVQQIMGAGPGNYGQAMQDFGVDQTTQYLNQLMGQADLSQFPNLQRLNQSPEGQTMMSQAFGAMKQSGLGGLVNMAGSIGSFWQEATRPPAHLDPNANFRPRVPWHKEGILPNIFSKPAPVPTAVVNAQNKSLLTPNTYRQGSSPHINNGRYQV